MKTKGLVMVLVAASFLLMGYSYAENREIVSLNGTWDVEGNVGDKEQPPSSWSHTTAVPGLVDYTTPDLGIDWTNPDIVKYVWLQRKFTLSPSQQKAHAILKIHKTMFSTKVWLNGQVVGGEYYHCFTSNEFNVDSVVKYDGTVNTLIVRVGSPGTIPNPGVNRNFGDDIERKTWVPGVWGDVDLVLYNKCRVEDVFVKPDITNKDCDIEITTENLNPTTEGQLSLEVQIYDNETNELVSQTVTKNLTDIAGGGKTTVTFADIALSGYIGNVPWDWQWSPEHPQNLYSVKATLKQGGIEIDNVNTRFGMREFKVINNDFYLNGYKITLKGGNISFHRFLSDSKRFNLPWDSVWIKKILSEIPRFCSFNYMRFHLGPAYDKWYDIADEGGILIADEWYAWLKPYTETDNFPLIKEEYSQWIKENRNHPSIISWSPINEPDQQPAGVAINREFYKFLLAEVAPLDPTRPWCLNDVFNILKDDLAAGYVIPVEFYCDHHPYAYSSNPPWDFQYFMSDLKNALLPKSAVAINEYGVWLDKNANFTDASRVYFDRWIRRDSPKEKLLEVQARNTAEITEMWRYSGVDAIAPYIYLDNDAGIGGNYFLDETTDGRYLDINNIKLKPVMESLKYAFRSLGVALELWDRHFYKGETRPVDIWLYNDYEYYSFSPVFVYIKFLRQSDNSLYSQFGPYTYGAPARSKNKFTIDVQFPSIVGDYYIVAEINPSPSSGRSQKTVYVIEDVALNSSDPVLLNGKIAVLDIRGEIIDYLSSKGLNVVPFESSSLTADNIDILLIGEGGIRTASYKSRLNEISQFVSSGHTLIIIEPSYGSSLAYYGEELLEVINDSNYYKDVDLLVLNKMWERGYDSYLFIYDASHPVWKDYLGVENIKESYLSMFNGGYGGEIVSFYDAEVSDIYRTLLRSSDGHKRVDMMEFPFGKGVIAITRLQTRGRLTGQNQNWQLAAEYPRRVDPVVQQYLLNLMSSYYNTAQNNARIKQSLKTEDAPIRVEVAHGQSSKGWWNLPRRAVDRIFETEWEGDAGVKEDWLILDLGIERTFNKIAFYWNKSFYATNYDIYVSNRLGNNVNWQHIKSVTGGGGVAYPGYPDTLEDIQTLADVSAKYIMVGFHNGNADHYAIREIKPLYNSTAASPVYFTARKYSGVNEEAKITLIDPDLSAQNSVDVRVTSSVDPVGIYVTLNKVTGTTDMFSSVAAGSNLKFSLTASDDVQNIIKINQNNLVTVTYAKGATNYSYSVIWLKENLALNKPVYVSSVEASNPELFGEKAVDGVLTTRWSSAFTDTEWIYVDLGKSCKLEEIVLNWEAAYSQIYDIQVSNDATNWYTFVSETNGHAGEIRYNVTSDVTGRYVRVNCLKRGTEWGNSLWEFEIYGKALASPFLRILNTYPRTVYGGTEIKVHVEWSGISTPQNYMLRLQLENWDITPGLCVFKDYTGLASSGDQDFTMQIPSSLVPCTGARFYAVFKNTTNPDDNQVEYFTAKDVTIIGPKLEITTYPKAVYAASSITLHVKWSNISNPSNYKLRLQLENWGITPGLCVYQDYTGLASGGDQDFTMNIPSNLASSTGARFYAVFKNTTNPDDNQAEYFTAKDVTTYSRLEITSYPKTVYNGTSITLHVRWSNISNPSNYMLRLQLENWDITPGLCVFKDYTGLASSGDQDFTLPIPNNLISSTGARFYAVFKNITNASDNQAEYVTAKDVTTIGPKLEITTYPKTVYAASSITLHVKWSGIASPSNYKLRLQLENWGITPGLCVYQDYTGLASSGDRDFTMNIPSNLASSTGARFYAVFKNITNASDNQVEYFTAKDVTTYSRLEITSYPKTVYAATSITLRVRWCNISNPSNYFLRLQLENWDKPEPKLCVYQDYNGLASSGDQNFTMQIPSSLVPCTGARFYAVFKNKTNASDNQAEYFTAKDVTTIALSSSVSVKKRTGTITIDGILNESNWSTANYIQVVSDNYKYNDGTSQISKVYFLWDSYYLYIGVVTSDGKIETADYDWNDDSFSLSIKNKSGVVKKYRQDMGGTGEGTGVTRKYTITGTLDNNTDTDTKWTVEMRISWYYAGITPAAGLSIPADFLVVDHDNNPKKPYNDPLTRFSKISWDGDKNIDTTNCTIKLVN